MQATLSESERRYRPTASKYKSGAHEMYITYNLEQKTRSNGRAIYPIYMNLGELPATYRHALQRVR